MMAGFPRLLAIFLDAWVPEGSVLNTEINSDDYQAGQGTVNSTLRSADRLARSSKPLGSFF
jgi:hypothetical protein